MSSFVLQIPQKLAKEKLAKALELEGDPNERLIDTIDRIKESLEKCEKEGLDSTDEDIYAGETRLEFLIAKNGMLKERLSKFMAKNTCLTGSQVITTNTMLKVV